MRNVFKVIQSTLPAFAVCLSFLLANNVISAEMDLIAFGSPDDVVVMDETWQKKSVAYDEKLGSPDLVITLGQHTYPALREFVENFAERKGVTIIVQQGTCGVSAKKLSGKMVDVAAFCCPPGKTDRLPGIEFHTIGIAPIALITNTSNEVSDISSSEAKNIFSGKSIKWSDVPMDNKIELPAEDIQPVVRLHCKKRPGHWRHILDKEDKFSPAIREVGVIPDMIKEVSSTGTAIGFETIFMLEVHKKNGEVKVLSIDGNHPADLPQLLSAQYPFYRSFSLTTWSEKHTANELAQELVESIKTYIEEQGVRYGMIASAELRQAGWKFNKEELTAEPDGNKVFSER